MQCSGWCIGPVFARHEIACGSCAMSRRNRGARADAADDVVDSGDEECAGQASGGILKASRLDFKLPGASGGFQACFGLPEMLIPGPENIKSGLNRAARPPYGLKLSENVATGPRMPLEALNGKKSF